MLRPLLSAAFTVGVAAAVTAALRLLHGPHTDAAAGLAYLVTVLAITSRFGPAPGVFAAFAAALFYSYYFLSPTNFLLEADDYVALGAFLVGSAIASELVLRERRHAEEVERRRAEVVTLAAERERLLVETAHLETLRESEAFKTSLLRAVSHNLQTPITAIRLGLEGLKRHPECPGAPLTDVLKETERLSLRIDALLSFARLDAGSLPIRVEPTPAADLFRMALESLRLVLAERTVDCAVSDDCPDLLVDPQLAIEILVNLLENAARLATSPTSLELAATGSHGSGTVTIELKDRGPGLDATSGESGRGGLGLRISHALAKALSGSLALTPRPDGGTIARLTLPAAP